MQAVKALYKQGQIQLLEPLNGITEAELFIIVLDKTDTTTHTKLPTAHCQLLQENFPVRRPQPALPRHHHGAHQRLRLDRRRDQYRRGKRFQPALRPVEASGREIRHGKGLRKPEVRGRPGARRRRGPEHRRPHRCLCGGSGELRVHPQPQRLCAHRTG